MKQIIVDSLIAGSVYTVMALGIVAVFKTTRVFNFAQGQMAAFGGYVAFEVASRWHVPFLVLALAGAAAGAMTAVVAERLILVRLYQRSPLELVVATFGISLVLRALIQRIWGYDTQTIPAPFPGRNLHILGTSFSAYGGLVLAVGVTIVIGLSLVLSRTDIGLALRATFDDPVAGRLTGIRVGWMRSLSWIIGGALAGLGGVLLTPLVYLTPDTMDTVLIIAFAAAVVGGLQSFYGAVVGGFVVAMTSNLIANYVSLGYRNVLVYIAVLVFLWVRPQGLFGEAEAEHSRQEGEPIGFFGRLSNRATAALGRKVGTFRQTALHGIAPQWILVVTVIGLMFAAPSIMGRTYQLNLITWLVDLVAVAGLALIAFYVGRISLAQSAFMAIGAYSMPHLLEGRVAWWPAALVGAMLITGVLGLVFETLSLRLHGAYYAVATLALALIVPLLADKWISVTGGPDGIAVPYATWHGKLLTSENLYYIYAGIAAAVLLVLLLLRNSNIGRTVVAYRDSPEGGASLGLAGAPRRIMVGATGAALGGLAGAMSALQTNVVTSAGFGLEFALTLFVAAVLAGSIIGSSWGAAVIVLVPVWLKSQPTYSTAAFGLILIITLFVLPRGRDVADVLRRTHVPRDRRDNKESTGQEALGAGRATGNPGPTTNTGGDALPLENRAMPLENGGSSDDNYALA